MVSKILYVEDNDDIREITTELLTHSGYHVTPVINGLEALEAFRHRKFDLIITDIFMPVMDGNQLIAELEKYSELPPILVLSYNNFDIIASPVITMIALKPLTLKGLRNLIESIFPEIKFARKRGDFNF